MPHAEQDRLHTPNPHPYAVETERFRHDQAVWAFGEATIFILMWGLREHKAGIVERCSECYLPYGKQADVYRQPARHKCPTCFGTTFEGGYRARIIRPALWDFGLPEEDGARRGVSERQSATVQSTHDFKLDGGDYLIRGDGSRWQVGNVNASTVRTGFEQAGFSSHMIGITMSQVSAEEDTAVVHIIPPSEQEVKAILAAPDEHSMEPPDYSQYEDVRGPLFP